ncbi:hypothetical protein [Ekhidna sp.]
MSKKLRHNYGSIYDFVIAALLPINDLKLIYFEPSINKKSQ